MKRWGWFGVWAALAAMIVVSVGVFAPPASVSDAATVTVTNGVQFTTTGGQVVHAHGGGVIKVGSYYYWFGENRNSDNTFYAVSCYRSTDLKNWEFVNNVLTQNSHSELNVANIERPKVIYNSSTGKYVMWMHKENGSDYSEARAAVASSDTVCGNYTYHGSFRPLGYMSRDLTLFKDDDGTAYMISAANNNADLHIYRLTSDYLDVQSRVQLLWAGQYREAPAMFKRNGVYFLVTSGATGWQPNQQKYATATSITGTWSSLSNFGNSTAYVSQTAFVLPIQGSQTTSYLYMGDRWAGACSRPVNESTYVWLPLSFPSNTSLSMSWYGKVNIDAATGTVQGVSTPIDTSAYYKIVARHSCKALGVENGSTDNMALIKQYTYNGATSMQWQFVDAGGGYYKIKNRNSGKLMGVQNGSTSNGARLDQYTDGGWTSQQWQLIDLGGGFYKLKNRNSGKVADIVSASTSDGADAIQYDDNGNANQWFLVMKIE